MVAKKSYSVSNLIILRLDLHENLFLSFSYDVITRCAYGSDFFRAPFSIRQQRLFRVFASGIATGNKDAVEISESVAVRTLSAPVLCEKRKMVLIFALYGAVDVEGVVRLLSNDVLHIFVLNPLLWTVVSVEKAH